ncbi:polyphosphate kinase 1 [Gracilinema caldarium]|uniref:Polyphosphate kinase n=1 Tax=Gracilinema caldarium (strain ATCC 51460 / DSM 7334 / H1) TaxID=744872 RepID=F8EY27_GRAC1|nr:polyphosphate kinase 1 [Gracilinema caldarium]AEJ20688.1 Polyphosphate kinase [Gracilinema caldarium DSM 7334]
MQNVPFRYFNRDLSWVDFNARVLGEALRRDLPVLDRLKFLTIVASNFDEFFMVRVAAIKRAQRMNLGRDASGLLPEEQLSLIAQKVQEITKQTYECLNQDVLPELAKIGLELIRPDSYSQNQFEYLENLFQKEVFPILTPLRLEEDMEPPSMGNLKLHGAFLLDNGQVAIVQVPTALDRIIWLPPEPHQVKPWTLLDDIVMMWAYRLFNGYTIKEAMLFKITRDADFAVDEERDEDFVEAMTEVLQNREHSWPVRLSYTGNSPILKERIARLLKLDPIDIYEMLGPIDLRSLSELAFIKGFDQFREEPWPPLWPVELPEDEPLWDTLHQRDVLLQLPYHTFDPVIRFIQDAALDPQVLAIKITLYRTSGDSPIVKALEQAARNGKQVTVLVELKARFDEERNITWASRLERAGVIVVYGIAQLKVHAKICLVVRREENGICRYIHLSTGNYNDKTARLYSDLSLFTIHPQIAQDATLFFNMITGYSVIQSMQQLVIAPVNLKRRLIELIDREAKRSSQEYPGKIVAKLNSLADVEVINALYRASQAGVSIQLNIRGICMLVPGVSGLSENIHVVSLIDRYLEHSRIIYFANGGAEELYLSSADWMSRNLDRRIELMVPILDHTVAGTVKDILFSYFKDTTHSHVLGADGRWTREAPEPDMELFRAQEFLYSELKKACELSRTAPRQEFVVRRRPPAE